MFGFNIPSTILVDPDKNGYKNHKSTMLHPEDTQKKLDIELEFGRIAGPFKHPPLENMFFFLPLGLVPRKNSGECRLIHDFFHRVTL